MSATEDLKILQNIIAQSDSGLNDPMLIGKFAKAKAMMHQMDSMDMVKAQMPPTVVPTQGNTPPISPQVGQTTTQEQPLAGASPTTDMGQGELQLP